MIPLSSIDREGRKCVMSSHSNGFWYSLVRPVVSAVLGLALSAGFLNAGQQSATRMEKPHPTPHQHPSPTPTPSATPTVTPSATPTATPSATPTATPSATPTATPSATPTATPSTTPTATPSTTPTATPSTTPTVTPTPTPTPPDNTFLTGLYAYYKLDETGGGATDASGNAKALSNFGDFIGTATGLIDSSRDFDGVSGTTLIRNANTTDFFCGSNPFSFSFWVKFDTFPLFNDVGLCNRYEPYGRREYIVFLSKATNKITFDIDAGDGVHAAEIAWGTTAVTGTWYHVAGGWDGAQIKLSVNAGPFVTAAYSTPMTNGGDNFKLGYEAQSLDGKMDEFGFWIGRCLTQTEVGQLYNNGSGLPFSSFR